MSNWTGREIAKKIMDFDNNYYKLGSNFKSTDYGILYYNTDDPTWTDFNHASIINYDKNSDFDAILRDIKDFYTSRNLRPFVYSNFVVGQCEIMKESLIRNGFTIEDNYGGQNYVIHTSECGINAPYSLKIRQINKNEDLSFLYELMEYKEDADDVAEAMTEKSDFKLFVGYLDDGTPVTTANLEYFNGVVLLDYVETVKNYQHKSYASQMIRFLVDYHYKNYKDCLLYLYYDNLDAGRIYKKAGFTKADIEMWAAYIDID